MADEARRADLVVAGGSNRGLFEGESGFVTCGIQGANVEIRNETGIEFGVEIYAHANEVHLHRMGINLALGAVQS